ncbi:DinB family protein [Tundrisphaera lichenicola]|uniref:DinB family protein n=1 Tax=Tundrisphaera lichenicola TaxID=2029860 RepID=UPI003EC0151D
MSAAPPIEDYLAGIWALRSAVAGMTQEQLRARPVEGKWSTLEVVAHLADFDPIYADRIKRIIASERPLVTSAGHKDYAANLAYQDRDIDEELDLIEATRKSLARTLRAVGPEALERVGLYRDDQGAEDERTAGRLFALITGHIPHHIAFIVEKRRALGLPEVVALG